jgi:nitrogenase molybdenum-iron protein beta chain
LDGDLFVVLTGCTAGIIGDDIDSVIKEFEDSQNPIIGVETAGFKGDTYFGYTTALTAILQELPQKTKTEERIRYTAHLLYTKR